MNLVQAYKAVEEGYQRGFSRRLREYRLALLIVPILVVTFPRVVDIEAANLRQGLVIKVRTGAYSSS